MRFEVRKNNQVWHVFDTEDYCAVCWYGDKGQAQRYADDLNSQPRPVF